MARAVAGGKKKALVSATIGDVFSLEPGAEVCVVAMVHWLGAPKVIDTWNGGNVVKVEAEICDKSWPVPLAVTFWGLKKPVEGVGLCVRLEGKVSEWRGRSLNVRKECATTEKNKELKRWYFKPGTKTALKKFGVAAGMSPRTEAVLSLYGEVCQRGRRDFMRRRRDAKSLAGEIFRRPEKLPAKAMSILGTMASSLRRLEGDVEREVRRAGVSGATKAAAYLTRRACERAVPRSLWGSKKNEKVAMDQIQGWLGGRLIGGRLDLATVASKLDAKKMVFFFSEDKKKNQQQASAERERLLEWLRWFASSLAAKMCRRFFVATLSDQCPRYFPAATWRRREVRYARKDCDFFLEEVSYEKAYRINVVDGRLEPKSDGGARLVQAMSRRNRRRSKITGASLQDVKFALTFETRRNTTQVGFGGSGGLDRLFRALKRAKRGGDEEETKLFHLATFDVAQCFDGIDQERLSKIARKALKEPAYYVILGKRGRALSADEPKPKRSRLVTRESLLAELDMLIFKHYVCIGPQKRYFHQKRGIPQGACVSSVLCDLYYGDFETKNFLKEDLTVVRVVDDTLAISATPGPLMKILDAYESAPNALVRLNPQKTHTTFSSSSSSETSSVTFFKIDIHRSLTARKKNQASLLRRRVCAESSTRRRTLDSIARLALNARMHALFFDADLNSRADALTNLRAAFDDVAARVLPRWKPHTNPTAARHQVHAIVRCAYAFYRRSHRKFNLERRLNLGDFYDQAYAALRPWLALPSSSPQEEVLLLR